MHVARLRLPVDHVEEQPRRRARLHHLWEVRRRIHHRHRPQQHGHDGSVIYFPIPPPPVHFVCCLLPLVDDVDSEGESEEHHEVQEGLRDGEVHSLEIAWSLDIF